VEKREGSRERKKGNGKPHVAFEKGFLRRGLKTRRMKTSASSREVREGKSEERSKDSDRRGRGGEDVLSHRRG